MRSTAILLLFLLMAGSQQALAQLQPAPRYASVYDTPSYDDDGMILIGRGWAKKPIQVNNGGQAPGIVTLVKAFNRVWHTYVVDGILKCAADPKFTEVEDEEYGGGTIVDRTNGYLCEDAGGSDGDNMEACVWKRDNGHRLFAITVSSNCDPDFSVICFYDYDPATQTLTPEKSPVDTFMPQEGRDYWFSLPRRGKDFIIREYLHDTSEIADNVFKWDGMKHVFSHQTKRPDN